MIHLKKAEHPRKGAGEHTGVQAWSFHAPIASPSVDQVVAQSCFHSYSSHTRRGHNARVYRARATALKESCERRGPRSAATLCWATLATILIAALSCHSPLFTVTAWLSSFGFPSHPPLLAAHQFRPASALRFL